MIPEEEITGIILAGGKSSRMGLDKGLIRVGDRPLVEWIILKLSGICQHLLISTNNPEYNSFGVKTVADIYSGRGPIGGIYSGLEESRTCGNFIISVDTPFVSREMIHTLIREAEGYDICVPWYKGNHYEPLVAYYKRDCRITMRQMLEQGNSRAALNLLKDIPTWEHANPEFHFLKGRSKRPRSLKKTLAVTARHRRPRPLR